MIIGPAYNPPECLKHRDKCVTLGLSVRVFISPCGSTAFAMKPPYTFIGFSCRKSIFSILPGYPKKVPVVDFDRILL